MTTKQVKTFLDEKPSTTLLRTRNEPGLVSGSFDNATEPFEKYYMDLWDKHSHPSSDGFSYIMILLDSYTRKVWHEFMKSKLPDEYLAAYKRIEARLPKPPKLLFVDREGATAKKQADDEVFEKHVEKNGTVLMFKQGRNDLAPLDGFMGHLGATVKKNED